MPNAIFLTPDTPLVVCLCAGWCYVCEDFRPHFEQVQRSVQAHDPQVRFLWVDVEDDADWLEPLEVSNFPTLLLAVGHVPRFFAPIMPRPQTLERLVYTVALEAGTPALPDPQLQAAVVRILNARPGP